MNPYQILGISPSASDDEVKKAYRTLSKKYHPDANIGNPHQAEYTEKFKEVQNAYKPLWMKEKEVLNNKAMVVKQRERVVINIKEMIRKLTKKLTVLFKVDVIRSFECFKSNSK